MTWDVRAWDGDDKLKLDAGVDADWAKGPDRKSARTSRGCGERSSGRGLERRALECYAHVTGTAEWLGMKLLSSDLGLRAEVRTWKDSNAAQGDSVEKELEKDMGHRVGMLAGGRGDQFGKSENRECAVRVHLGGSLDEREGQSSD